MCGVTAPPVRSWRMGYSEILLGADVSSWPMRATLLLFSVNQIRFPLAAMPYGLLSALGSVKYRGALDPAGASSSPSCPDPAVDEHVGAKSQPGSANQTLPVASIAVPHTLPTAAPLQSEYSWTAPAVGRGVAAAVDVGVG